MDLTNCMWAREFVFPVVIFKGMNLICETVEGTANYIMFLVWIFGIVEYQLSRCDI